jgi:hypothetical protein
MVGQDTQIAGASERVAFASRLFPSLPGCSIISYPEYADMHSVLCSLKRNPEQEAARAYAASSFLSRALYVTGVMRLGGDVPFQISEITSIILWLRGKPTSIK